MLRVENIDFYYSQTQVLYDVSFEVQESEFVALIGANGAGKTTTMKNISGLLHPRLGKIEFLNQQIHNLEPHQITSLGLVHIPEGRKLFPSLTVRENLAMGSYIKKPRKRRSQTMEQVFSLFPVLKKRETQIVRTLSGGEQQMLAIGRGLMSMPKLLMVDEPSLGLAPLVTKTIFDTITEINLNGTTILLVEQNVFASLKMAHRGYVLENGKVVLQGDSKKLLVNEDIKKAYLGI